MKKIVQLMCCLFLIFGLIGCQKEIFGYKVGTYTAKSNGFSGEVSIELKVSESIIEEIKVDAQSETAAIGGVAAEKIVKLIVEKQSLAIDAVAGATVTSNAVLAAAEDALKQAGGNIESLKQATSNTEKEVLEITTDIVVVGAGGAGSTAAVTAAEAGANVILLEKTAIAGGTTANGGGFFAADSQVGRDAGLGSVDTDLVFNKYMEEMDWQADARMIRLFLETSKTTADWLVERGWEIHKMASAVQQTHESGTNGYHKYDDFTATSSKFMSLIEKTTNLKTYYETAAYELIVNESNEVVGVYAKQSDGTILKISAKSVVLATGGFVGNDEMVTDVLDGVTVNAAGYNSNVGDGINMAVALGAKTQSMTAMVNHTFKINAAVNVKGEYDPMSKMYGTASLSYIPTNIWINQNGDRIANEDIVYDRMLTGDAMYYQGGYAWFVYNQNLIDTLENSGAAATGMYDKISMGPFAEYTPMNVGWANLNAIVNEMVDGTNGIKADSIEDLAKQTGINVENLLNTMNVYNDDAVTGKDTVYNKRAEHMFDLSTGPYYAFKVSVNNLSTVGGLRINSNMNVVYNDPQNGYTPIMNLYAAGADASVLYSDHYAHTIEGTAQGWAYASGRLAGQAALKNIGIYIEIK